LFLFLTSNCFSGEFKIPSGASTAREVREARLQTFSTLAAQPDAATPAGQPVGEVAAATGEVAASTPAAQPVGEFAAATGEVAASTPAAQPVGEFAAATPADQPDAQPVAATPNATSGEQPHVDGEDVTTFADLPPAPDAHPLAPAAEPPVLLSSLFSPLLSRRRHIDDSDSESEKENTHPNKRPRNEVLAVFL
jgi:hypothetical protein